MSWLIKTPVGINMHPETTAYESVNICPVFFKELDYCNGYTDTPKGRISVNWKRIDGAVKLIVTLPENVTASCPYGTLTTGINELTVPQ